MHYDAGWARYALARHDTLVPIPDHLPFDEAAIIPDAVQVLRIIGAVPIVALVLVGLMGGPLTLTDGIGFSVRGRRLLGHYGSMPVDVEVLVALTAYHRLDFAESISGHVPLADAADAVRMPADRVGDPIRLVLVP